MRSTKIEWCSATFNPWIGCTKVSPACDHCYAEQWSLRFGRVEWGAERKRTSETNWRQPIIWNKRAEATGERIKVFCASMADVFDNQVPEEWRRDLFDLIGKTPRLDWLLLTKRPQNMAKFLPEDWGGGWPNVWLGATAENQIEAYRRVPYLAKTPAVRRFLSYEPALGPAVFDLSRIDWVIAGEESGGGARAANRDWFRSVRNQCGAAGAAFFMKQLTLHGKKIPYEAWPADLKIRETPEGNES